MKSLTPFQSLIFLLLISLAIGGWLYGIHWKRVASGDLFTNDEKLTIRLQEQVEALNKQNGELRAEIKSITDEPGDPGIIPARSGPELPARPQKIETH